MASGRGSLCTPEGFKVKIITVKWNRKLTVLTPEEALGKEELEKLAKYLKRSLGTGGFVREGSIYLRGDMTTRLCRILKQYKGN